ncbi:MAG: c-type cytochrome [Burkholderiales bacterium]|nr:c-type cytochrome [Burkholderiales bacterium]
MKTKLSQPLSLGLLVALVTNCILSVAQAPLPVSVTPPAPIPFAASNLTQLGVRALAANCAACHGTNGNSAGGAIPGLAGSNKEYFVLQMKAFKEGKREATVMHQIAKGYSEAEIAVIADFFSAQKK